LTDRLNPLRRNVRKKKGKNLVGKGPRPQTPKGKTRIEGVSRRKTLKQHEKGKKKNLEHRPIFFLKGALPGKNRKTGWVKPGGGKLKSSCQKDGKDKNSNAAGKKKGEGKEGGGWQRKEKTGRKCKEGRGGVEGRKHQKGRQVKSTMVVQGVRAKTVK